MDKKLFQWQAYNTLGKKIKGLEPAHNRHVLKAELVQRGLFKPQCRKATLSPLSRQRINLRDITRLFDQLSRTMAVGIPIVQALNTLENSMSKPLMRWLIRDLQQHIQTGHSLHTALAQHPSYFAHTDIQLVKMAEMSGNLDQTLQQIAEQRLNSIKLKTKIRKALTYPTMVLGVGLAVSLVMLTVVVPQFAMMYRNFNATLPWLTRGMIQFAEALKHHGGTILLVTVLSMMVFVYCNRRFTRLKACTDRLIFRIPLLGTLIRQSYQTLWAQTLGTLTRGGIPLLDGLQSLTALVNNIPYQNAMTQVVSSIQTGQSLEKSIAGTDFFCPELIQAIHIGEQTGQLDQILNQCAQQFSWRIHARVDQLSSLIEPIIMTVIGSIVGILVIGMYLPIFQMGNVI